MRRRLKGFTTIELLIVIGLILFLISLMFVGLKHVTGQARISDTKTQLDTAETILRNYENATHFQRFPYIAVGTQDLYFWIEQPGVYQGPGSGDWNDIRNNFSPDGGGIADTGTPQTPVSFPPPSLMQRTLVAMQTFMTVPENATLIANLPTGKTKSFPLTLNGTPVSVPVLLDGWGNPILFIPAGGLANIQLSADSTGTSPTWHTQFSTGIYPNGHPSSSALPADRPFFFSVGPDSDASKGDDNIYPF